MILLDSVRSEKKHKKIAELETFLSDANTRILFPSLMAMSLSCLAKDKPQLFKALLYE